MRPWKTLPTPASTKTAELQIVQDTYENNLKRVYLLAIFPPALVNTTQTLTRITTVEQLRHRKDILEKKIDYKVVQRKIMEAVARDAEKRDEILRQGGTPAQKLLQKEINNGLLCNEPLPKGTVGRRRSCLDVRPDNRHLGRL
jgi:hypothetical protein